MDLNKHTVAPGPNISPFHSNGIARVANGNQIGATANVNASFNQRLQTNGSRQFIRSYQNSTIGNAHGVLGAKPVARGITSRLLVPVRLSSSQRSAGRQFSEPKTRGYNPYS